jgi:hypothetical protein
VHGTPNSFAAFALANPIDHTISMAALIIEGEYCTLLLCCVEMTSKIVFKNYN